MLIRYTILLIILILVNEFNHVNLEIVDEVRKKYCAMVCEQHSHTVCKRFPCTNARRCGASYKFDYLTDREREVILELHNQYRSRHAMLLKKYSITEKFIVNMMMLQYRKEIEYIAACHVRDCTNSRNDMCRSFEKEPCGQNIFTDDNNELWDTKYKGELALNISFSVWIEQFNVYSGCSARNYSKCKKKYEVRHYLQIIWAKTELLGCAKMKSSRGVAVVCNYCPAGLVEGQSIFETGESRHPSCAKDARYELLCASREAPMIDAFEFPDMLTIGGGAAGGGGFWSGTCTVTARVEVVTVMLAVVVFYPSRFSN